MFYNCVIYDVLTVHVYIPVNAKFKYIYSLWHYTYMYIKYYQNGHNFGGHIGGYFEFLKTHYCKHSIILSIDQKCNILKTNHKTTYKTLLN